jgi:hypothetical protein
MNIFTNATRKVLILFSIAIAIGLFTGNIQENTFKDIALMVFTFFFAKSTSQDKIDNKVS